MPRPTSKRASFGSPLANMRPPSPWRPDALPRLADLDGASPAFGSISELRPGWKGLRRVPYRTRGVRLGRTKRRGHASPSSLPVLTFQVQKSSPIEQLPHLFEIRLGQTARSPAEWPGFVVSATCLYRNRTTRSR